MKFYSSRVALDTRLETPIFGLYAAGDGTGVTRGLVQASVSGLVVGAAVAAAMGISGDGSRDRAW